MPLIKSDQLVMNINLDVVPKNAMRAHVNPPNALRYVVKCSNIIGNYRVGICYVSFERNWTATTDQHALAQADQSSLFTLSSNSVPFFFQFIQILLAARVQC